MHDYYSGEIMVALNPAVELYFTMFQYFGPILGLLNETAVLIVKWIILVKCYSLAQHDCS